MKPTTEQIENFINKLEIDKEHDIVIFDPYIISVPDMKALGIKNLVRVRRPGWGRGNVSSFIAKMTFDELKRHLEADNDNSTD